MADAAQAPTAAQTTLMTVEQQQEYMRQWQEYYIKHAEAHAAASAATTNGTTTTMTPATPTATPTATTTPTSTLTAPTAPTATTPTTPTTPTTTAQTEEKTATTTQSATTTTPPTTPTGPSAATAPATATAPTAPPTAPARMSKSVTSGLVSKGFVMSEDEQLWQHVQKQPEDFDTWVKLVKKVEKMDDLSKIRRSLEALLTEFPLCFGYWKRLSSHEKRHLHLEKAEKVLEDGVQATPRSHQLWTYYCQEKRLQRKPEETRKLFERGADAIGTDWASHHFWNQYLDFEIEQAQCHEGGPNHEKVIGVYLKILSSPIQVLDDYFEKFQTIAMQRVHTEVKKAWDNFTGREPEQNENGAPASSTQATADRADLMKEVSVLYSRTNAIKTQIAQFETKVQRPYFHVKPLEDKELQNWKDYITWATTGKGKRKKGEYLSKTDNWGLPMAYGDTVLLFERCLVPCANYPEMWHLYIDFVKDYDLDETRKIYTQATTKYAKRNVEIHISFATFEERLGEVVRAREVYRRAIELIPNSLELVIAWANLEKRYCAGDVQTVCAVYDQALQAGSENDVECVVYVSIHYAKFLSRHGQDAATVRNIYTKAVELASRDAEPKPLSAVLILAFADFEASIWDENIESRVRQVYDYALGTNGQLKLTSEHKLAVWEHFIAFMEDNASNIRTIDTLKERYESVAVSLKENMKKNNKRKSISGEASPSKQARTAPTQQQQYWGQGTPDPAQWAQYQQAIMQQYPHYPPTDPNAQYPYPQYYGYPQQ